jgi:hypothetical protein
MKAAIVKSSALDKFKRWDPQFYVEGPRDAENLNEDVEGGCSEIVLDTMGRSREPIEPWAIG